MCLSSLVGLGLVRKEENVIVIFRYHFLLKESMPLAFKNRLHHKMLCAELVENMTVVMEEKSTM